MQGPIAASAALERTSSTGLVSVYLELSKARLATLVVLTTVVGYVVAARGATTWWALLATAAGTALTAFGANILNQCWERDRDARMERTRNRPLPAGQVTRRTAVLWGLASAVVGLVVLALGPTPLAAALAASVILLYVLVYTPLKPVTPLNTVVGAVCGAVPPMIGWAAATGRLDLGAWILGGVLFVWQIPHFLALAWMYRDDYARGGFRMLPAVDPSGRLTARMSLVWSLALLPITASATWVGITGASYLVASQLLGAAFAWTALAFLRDRSRGSARRLFFASILYLPVLMGVMVTDMDDRVANGALVGREPVAESQRVAAPSSPQPPAAIHES